MSITRTPEKGYELRHRAIQRQKESAASYRLSTFATANITRIEWQQDAAKESRDARRYLFRLIGAAPERRIVTTHVCPPIPVTYYDWSAIDADTYGGEPGEPVGWGATRELAVADLLYKLEEEDE